MEVYEFDDIDAMLARDLNKSVIQESLEEPLDPVEGKTGFERFCNLLKVVKS